MASTASEIGSEQIKWAQKNQAFDAIMFVWLSFRSLLYHYDEKEKLESLDRLFKPFYVELSKEFVAEFSHGHNSDSEDKSAS